MPPANAGGYLTNAFGTGKETAEKESIEEPSMSFSEPFLSEAAVARFLGVSKMTMHRKRNAEEISFFWNGSPDTLFKSESSYSLLRKT